MYKNNTNSNPTTTVNRATTGTLPSGSNWGAGKTLADYVKESAAWSQNSSITTNNHHNHPQHHQQQNNNPTTSIAWAAAVKAPPDLPTQFAAAAAAVAAAANAATANSFDYNNSTIGSWSSPETSSSNRGWNADGSSKSDGLPDDGTAIWGNPVQKKTGVDWTEKESLLNPPQANNSDKSNRIQKTEPVTSSINGTEAWGAPMRSSPQTQNQIANKNTGSNQQQPTKNDISGNTYGTNNIKSNNVNSSNEPQLNWGERTTTAVIGSSSLSSSRNLQSSSNENSSPPNSNSVWNSNLGAQQAVAKPQKSSDWLANASSSSAISNNNLRMDELNKQLESANLFDSVSMAKGSVAGNSTNQSLEHNRHQHHHQLGLGLSGNNNGLGNLVGASAINDLKQQMSANYSNDLLGLPNRQTSNMPSSNNNQQQSQHQMDVASAYASASAPSRDLLKQMVHQIQLAVQAGHLNAHILNQPMSAPTLQLVYQLLQQIKSLHQFLELQQRSGGSKNSDLGSPSALDLQINRVRQNIALLQKAITQQQASLTKNEAINDLNVKQQQQQQQQAAAAAAAAAAVAAANNYSYASISKLSTNMKVPSNNNMSNVIGNINLDSFRRSSLIDTLSNSNSDSLRSAQATFDANATIDKSLSSLIQASSSANDILGSSKAITTSSDFSKVQQGFNGGNVSQQQNKGLFSAQQQTATSSSSNAWMAFSSGDFIAPGWSRISSNVSQEQQFNGSDIASEFGNSGNKAWPNSGSSILSEEKSNSSLAPGSSISSGNIGMRPNSGSNILKQLNESDFLGRDPSSFYDWSTNNSDSSKRSYDTGNGGGSSSSASSFNTGLSLQSNPWMFAPSSGPLNIGSGIDNLNKDSNNSGGNLNLNNKMDNGSSDKLATNSLFLKSSNPSNIQRSSSALYDWSDMASASSNTQFNADSNNQMSKQQQHQAAVGSAPLSGMGGGQSRPAPPPGLSSNFQPIIANSSSANGVSILDNKLGGSKEETSQLQSRESSSSLWSGAWFD